MTTQEELDRWMQEELLPDRQYNALVISTWLAHRQSHRQSSSLVPFGSDGVYRYAHEDPIAWDLVLLPEGMTQEQALELMEEAVRANDWLADEQPDALELEASGYSPAQPRTLGSDRGQQRQAGARAESHRPVQDDSGVSQGEGDDDWSGREQPV